MLTGDESLRRRPMARVGEPLRRMGAAVVGRSGGSKLPLAVKGTRPLRAITHDSPVASAQVKSAVPLAGAVAPGPAVGTHPPPPSRPPARVRLAVSAPLPPPAPAGTPAPRRLHRS